MDDTDDLYIDINNDQTLFDVHIYLQESTDNWGRLLITSVGVLTYIKCVYFLISFMLKLPGKCNYAWYESVEGYAIGVQTHQGSFEEIAHIGMSVANMTLGVYIC